MSEHDPDFAPVDALVRGALQAQGLFRHMGAEVLALSRGEAVVALPYRDEVAQHNGFFHGGAVGFLVDVACAAAAGSSLREPGSTVLTAEYKLNIVAPARRGRLVCRATVVKPGRSLAPVEAKVYAVEDGGTEKLVAVGLATLAVVTAERVAA
ncbi:PaaI family thioesterase [Caulobacter segnis]|uniref:PaaI family thioesterase n=1 Tax=Caulobacter segnis TaxID=88688 RepID=UPI00240EA37F|nr:PaaI family thioesterase [Caulobacter segnis]MDG2520999.1 PaaI family thioesterase [Caulobacter segnis]